MIWLGPVAELVYAYGLEPYGSNPVEVRVFSGPPSPARRAAKIRGY